MAHEQVGHATFDESRFKSLTIEVGGIPERGRERTWITVVIPALAKNLRNLASS